MVNSRRIRKWLTAGLALLVVSGSVIPAAHTTVAAPDNSKIVISQVYGGGGNNGAEYKNDFVELYNPTEADVDLTGWKVQYSSASAYIDGTIRAKGYYLIQQAAGTGGTKDLPSPDSIGTLGLGGKEGKVDLLDNSSQVIDTVAYGSAPGAETKAAPALSSTTSAIRKAAPGAPVDSRGQDTDNNSVDFVAGPPSPRNSSYGKAPETASSVVASPAVNAWPVGTKISLSSPTVGASVYAAVYGSGGSTNFQTYTGPITLTENTTIKAYASEHNMPDSPVTTFDYKILAKTDVATARLASKGQNVSTEGIVTHINAAKMYIQDQSGGIVLYGFPEFANVGDRVEVSGTMDIHSNLQEIKFQNELQYAVVAPDTGVPAPKLITATDLSAANGESYEAQLVTLNKVTIVSLNGNTVTASQGDKQFTIFSTLPKLVKDKTFDSITGVIEQFNTTYQFIPLNENALVEETFSVMASPGAGRIIKGSSVTLSSPTLGAQIYYTTDGTEPTAAASKLYSDPITVSKDLTIKAIVVADGKTSKVYTFAYKASDLPRIHDIQGESHSSEYAGQKVTNVEGIVTQYGYTFATGAYRGFFMQDPQPDNNVNTSEGIFVYSTDASLKPEVGNLVHVSGGVSEYNEGNASNLTSTQITMTSLKADSSSSYTVPAPVVLGKGGRVIPSSIIDNDDMANFEPNEDAIDFYESLEGMLVKLPTPTIISPYWTSGSGSSMLYNIPTRVENDTADVITPAGGLVLKEYSQFNPQRLIIAYGNPGQEVITGDKFAGDVTGVIGYNNGNFKVIPENGKLPAITPSTFKQETTTLEVNESKLLIASYNIENFYPGVGATKIQKLADSIANNMKKPDIIGVVEMQDSNGETDNGITEASANELIKAIETAGGPVYKYTDIAPENNKDGGAPGGNIRVGFLYNPARVQLADSVNKQKGTATQSVGYDAEAKQLTYNPGRIDPTNLAFSSSRKSLAAQFVFGGETVIVIANHFNSKSGDNGPFGNIQPPVLSSETKRHEIAAIVNGFVKEVLTANPEANVVALGDLNDFQFTKTATLLKGTELANLIDKLPLNERYTYTYDGNSQVLDHILVSKNLRASSKVDVVHLNADFSPSKGRVSDHDAVLAQLDFNAVEEFPLTVLHTNDTHAGLDTVSSPNNILRRVTAIKEAKATTENPILLDAGDVFSGTLYFNKYLGLADMAFMNMVKYDAMTFGNHEFDKDSETLSKFIGKAEFPFVSSNVNFSADDILSKMFTNEIGRSGNAATIYPALIKEVDGEQIGIIGLTTEDTANIASPGKVTFENAFAKAEATVAMLQNEKVNKIIVLSHLGYEEDLKLAKAVNGIDIIVGGHSHTQLDQAVVDKSDPNAPKLIVQTGEKGLFLGQLEVKFNKDGVLTDWKDQLVSIDAKNGANYAIAEDTEAKKLLDTKFKPGIKELSNEVVGNSEVILNGVRNDVRTKETNLGNLIADGMLYAAKKAGTNAVIALQNGGGIRESINEGPITQGEVLGVLPFNNDLVTITLTGQEIKDAMENGVSKTPTADGRFPHVAGLKFYYDSKKPVNERVLRIEVKNGDKYIPLDMNASYVVATNAFTAKGGDFYTSLEKAYKEGRVNLLYLPDFDVFTKYLNEVKTVTAKTSAVEGRIVDLKGEPLPETTPTPVPTSPTSPTVPTATPAPTVAPIAKPQVTTINAADLTKQLSELAIGSHELVIPVKATTGGAQVVLPGSVLVKQAAAQPNTILTFTTAAASYSLPLSIINSAALAAQLGTNDFTITVSILLADSGTVSSTNKAIASQLNNATLAAPVIEFSVSAQAGTKRVPLNNFGSTYVNRTINVPASLNSNNATAVVFDPATGKISFVPALFAPKADGTTDVTIKRNSNSYYTVVKYSKTFGDINGHWAKSSINLLASKLIVSGTNNNTFSPSQSITRAEFAALITRSLGLATVSGETTFKDVNPNAWYADAIRTAAEAELISGYTDGSFKPGSPITRQEMASVLAKAIKYTGKTLNADPTALAKFIDAASIPAWSQAAVAEIAAAGIIQGATDGSFAPQKLATRAEAVTMLEKTLKFLQFIN
ncbi:5'-nucleotidase C-terminal domain-containing protein [Paenibacillus etheri]|uniref:Multifunctional nuclease/2',3'-cyclic-nucleotide 2'-phosphodiesterase/5'-nucleotidase/3'-nucleotidase n=1 Tax=Paenibacillus etheri TaxID=1306852 RepID=A0A0W1AQE7_9BACL|nr:5'-nucleotidase C-terminal domain-containing protein [Paenibacillus etheri]KTD83459.1 multifunctional nuclease/2',3'-cyclic-nucleotide 2'-phosphodiesterase/5'-nucleotidase/3'-nucleotidase [Paenibacillus etheri]